MEKHLAVNRKVYCAFVDLEKAYDSVVRSKLGEVLAEYDVEEWLLNVIRAMYVDSEACVRVDGEMSEWFGIRRGVRQGCVMSPWLFNVFMDNCIRESHIQESGVQVG